MFKKNDPKTTVLLLFVTLTIIFIPFNTVLAQGLNATKANQEIFNTLTFDELEILAYNKPISPELKVKLDYVMNNVAVDNTINTSAYPTNESPSIGRFLRMTSWNIERGMRSEEIKTIFTNPDNLFNMLQVKNMNKIKTIKEQIETLRHSDVLLLTEIDAGMPRTKYNNVVEDLARSLGFNYAFAIEFLEVDPAHLGLEDYVWSEERKLFPNNTLTVDKERFRGIHGSAILSRYPLRNVRLVRLPDYYGWFTEERKEISRKENLKRLATSKILSENTIREIRYGSRIALIAETTVPGIEQPITLVSTHIENRTTPENRTKQLNIILDSIAGANNPVVIAGDFNTINTAQRVKLASEKIKQKHEQLMETNPEYKKLHKSFLKDKFAALKKLIKKSDNPVAKASIGEKFKTEDDSLFDALEKFRFADGCCFDFRSTVGKALGLPGELGNSNFRDAEDFRPTFTLQRSFYIGKFKLDWFFVKPFIKKPDDNNGPYRLAPHYGNTLFDLNYGFNEALSDHAPITIDLPITEPLKGSN